MIILDGGMGRELLRRGAPFRQPEWSALALYEQPSAVQNVHQDFIQCGANVITTNSYAIVPFHIGEQRFQTDSQYLAELAGQLAKRAVKNSGVLIAGSLPPLFGSYRPDLFRPEFAQTIAQPLINGLSPYVDLWLLETQSCIAESLTIKGFLPQDNRPLWVSFTLKDDVLDAEPCLRSGESVQSAVEKMLSLGVQAILFNCCQPEVIEAALLVTKQTLLANNASHIQVGAYANAFQSQQENTANDGLDEVRKDLDPQAYLAWAKKWQAVGATIIGGCCGIGPEHIQVLAKNLNK